MESKRIRVLEQANPRYREARRLVRLALRERDRVDARLLPDLDRVEQLATRALVDAINAEAEFYFGRTSTGRAKRLNAEALKLLPTDGRAVQLARDIRNAANGGAVVSRG
jgi:hypothetical protein